MSLVVVTPPTVFCVSTGEVTEHLRLSSDDISFLSEVIIPGAQAMIEEMTGRRLSPTTLRLGLEEWPDDDELWLPGPPVASITSITYLDSNNVRQTLAPADYVLDADSEPALLTPAYGLSWPTALDMPGSIKITYITGYASAPVVPASLRAAVLLSCGHKWEQREALLTGTISKEIEFGIAALCAPYDVRDRFV